MCHKKIRIPRESANEIMRALGSLKNSIEFEDLTKGDIEARRNFEEMIKRCDNSIKKYMIIIILAMILSFLLNIINHLKNLQKI